MSSNPLISIVMPNYNGHKYVSEAIYSVLNQTYKNFELLVVDDASTDNSLQLIKCIAANDSRVRVLELKKNCGVANARNCGISEAKGTYIALLDNDDLWVDCKLERQVQLAQNGGLIFYCSYDFIDENGEQILKPFIVPQKTTYREMLSSNYISCSTCLVDAQLLKMHPFRSDYYHEDYALWMELLSESDIAYGDNNVLMHYRQSSNSRSHNKVHSAVERFKIYREILHLNIFQSSFFFLCYCVKGINKYCKCSRT